MSVREETIEDYVLSNQEFLLLAMASKYYGISYHYLCNDNLDRYNDYQTKGYIPLASKIQSLQDTLKHAEDLYSVKHKKLYGDKK